MQYDSTELFKIVTIDTDSYLFLVEILLIECINSHHVSSEFLEECSIKILQPILCDNHFRICRGLFFLHFVIFWYFCVFPNFLLFFFVFSHQEISVFFSFLSCFSFFLLRFFNFIIMSLYSFVVFLAYLGKN